MKLSLSSEAWPRANQRDWWFPDKGSVVLLHHMYRNKGQLLCLTTWLQCAFMHGHSGKPQVTETVQQAESAELSGISGTEGSIWNCVRPLQALCRKDSWRFIKPLKVMHSVQQMLLTQASGSSHLRPLSSLPWNSWLCLGAWLWQNEPSNGSWLTPVSKTYIF